MKKKVTRLLSLLSAAQLLSIIAMSQAPEAIPYQAAARNSNGVIIPNKNIRLRFSVHDLGATGTVLYKETQNAVTNVLGLFVVNIGQGTVVSGSFQNINWASGKKFMQVELDTTGAGSAFVDMGTQQLLSVPYALSSADGVPVGSIMAYMGNNPPVGWLLCDGTVLSRTTYARLFAVIGTASGIGYGDNATFNVPDLRGVFLRGRNAGGGLDPDTSMRIAINGGNRGDAVGSYQIEEFGSHSHTLNSANISINDPVAQPQLSLTQLVSNGTNYGNGRTNTLNTSMNPSGGSETRPKNIYVNYIIKY